jgi:hypothetical protein
VARDLDGNQRAACAHVVFGALGWLDELHSGLEDSPWQARLPYYGQERANLDFGVIGHRYRHRCFALALLHDDVAAALADVDESMLFQKGAELPARKIFSLPNSHLKPRNEHLVVHAALNFRSVGRFKEQLQGFDQVRSRFVDRRALASNIHLRAKGNIAVALPLDDCRQLSSMHGHKRTTPV